jgi:hypothetical protein
VCDRRSRRSLRAAQGAKREAGSTTRSYPSHRERWSGLPGWQIQRTSTPTSQWFTGSRTTDADVRCAS